MRRTMLRILACAVFVVATVSLSSDGAGQERARLRVSTLFIGSSLLPFWFAQDQGYFNRAGVDVELIWMQSNLSTSALLAGLGQPVDLSYQRIVDHSIVEEIARAGGL